MTNVIFTKTDHEILNSYKNLIEGMANYLGEGYEIVLHSLEDLQNSVIKIINGHHTGRKEGSPITDLALSMLAKIQENSDSDHISYFTTNKNGEMLKACTIAIRGQKNKVIGLLCMNFYLNTPYSKVIEALIPQKVTNGNNVQETFAENVDDLIKAAFDEVKKKVLSDSAIQYSNRNKEIISQLYQKGIFNLKDSVIKIAMLLGISKNTVYMHIRNIQI